MEPIGGASFLDAWERSRSRPPAERPAALLETGLTGRGGAGPDGDPARLPLGERDRRLLELRLAALGPSLELCGDCPACGETLEVTVDGAELLAAWAAPGEKAEPVTVGDLTLRLRPVTADDLARAAAAGSSAEAERRLLEGCVVEALRDGERVAPGALSPDERDAASAALAAADPGAELRLDLACPDCGHAFRAPLDVAALVTAEIDDLARRLLGEVAALARGYGWRESDILAMSPVRRRAYLELLGP